ncbi:MAG: class I SAM-dependent methyltransferase [Planctomycetota bacterium]
MESTGAGDGVLDSLLYEPKRRRIAMSILAVVLVLAVGFAAAGMLIEGASLLTVFGAGFIAASIFFLCKLVVVSHVHLRGTAARLEALNDRYDDTARWLERFDADTRESFLVAKRRLEAGDTAQNQLKESLNKLGVETPRLEVFEKLAADTPRTKTLEQLEEGITARHDKLESAIAKLRDAQKEAREELKRLLAEDRGKADQSIDALRAELPDLQPISEQINALQSDFTSLQSDIASASTRAAELADAAKSASAEELKAARQQLDEAVRDVNGRLTKFHDEHDRKRRSAVQAAKEEAVQAASKLSRRLDDSAQLSSRLRGEGYVRFSRVLSGEAIEAASAFGAKVTPAHLKYLERKLQVIEGICEGRLAGSVDDAIGRVLAGHLVRGKELRILEIGVLFGVGAAFMHHALAPRHSRVLLTLLDPFQGYYGKDQLDPPTGLPVTRASVERNLARCGIDDEGVTILEGFSNDESIREQAEQSGPYHVIVIDGDHSAEGVRGDFEGYAEMLRSGGLLIIDDYGSDDWPDVTAFVDQTVRSDPRFKPVAVMGKTAVFKRGRTPSVKKVGKGEAAKRSQSSSEVAPKPAAANAQTVPATKARPEAEPQAEAQATPKAKKAATSKRAASKKPKTGEAEAAPPTETPAGPPIVETPRRAKRAAKKSASKSSKVTAVAEGASDNAE